MFERIRFLLNRKDGRLMLKQDRASTGLRDLPGETGTASEAVPMVPEITGRGPRMDYEGYWCGTGKIRWVSTQKDPDGVPIAVREPKEQTKKYSHCKPFVAAGRKYESLKQLYAVDSGDHMRFKDIYGRRVFYDAERFPCFDSYDFLYDDRCYRWFFILEEGKLTRVYHTDGRNTVHVTEDVGSIEDTRWEQMLKYKFFEWEG